jgi:hypothetical protein
MAVETLPYARAPGSYAAMEAIKQAIDDGPNARWDTEATFGGARKARDASTHEKSTDVSA